MKRKKKNIIKENITLERIVLSKEEALEMFKDDKYKIDLIQEMSAEEIITAYKQADFIDLCRGPHLSRYW